MHRRKFDDGKDTNDGAEGRTGNNKTVTTTPESESQNQDSSTDEKRQILKRRVEQLAKRAKNIEGLADEDILSVFLGGSPRYGGGSEVGTSESVPISRPSNSKKSNAKTRRPIFVVLSVIVLLPIFIGTLACLAELDFSPRNIMDGMKGIRCLVENNGIAMEAARPIVNCTMCSDLHAVPVETVLTKEDFIKKYAYSAIPVLVKGATANWTAMSLFNFKFFKVLYESKPDALSSVEDECQFFPYNTDFLTLEEVFNMSEARASFEPGQEKWYVGWSNCHPETASELRKHYTKPYFLPDDSESSALDWIFMGGSGDGANLHLDYVQRPSWQAQIQGRKTWELVPPPECEASCYSMNVTVEKGDIFVIDTNTWYHSTYIHPGEISITIGSEYD